MPIRRNIFFSTMLALFVVSFLVTSSAQANLVGSIEPPKPEKKAVVQQRDDIPDIIGEERTVTTSEDDTLVELAVKEEIGYVALRAANKQVDHLLPGDGTSVVIPNRHILPDAPKWGVVINLGELRLYYFPPEGDPVTYPIGVGREGLDTPTGQTIIRQKVDGPKWRPTPRMRKADPSLPAVVEPGPENPLGTHALYLGWPAYLIHGTYKPTGIGRRVSSGCIRMYPDHIIKVFNQVPTQTPVTVVNEPVKIAVIDDHIYIEAEPNATQSDEIEFESAILSPTVPDGIIQRIKNVAQNELHKNGVDWGLVQTALIERTGQPIDVTNVISTTNKDDISGRDDERG